MNTSIQSYHQSHKEIAAIGSAGFTNKEVIIGADPFEIAHKIYKHSYQSVFVAVCAHKQDSHDNYVVLVSDDMFNQR